MTERVTGLAARKAALHMLDGVLRQGLPLDSVAERATASLYADADRGLAVAIAGEVLRHLPDLDRLIDGAMKRPLPDDAKARMVLRMALAQALSLGTPPHAAISTALPLLAGGPRRLAHGVFGTLMRQDAWLPDPPALPGAVRERWTRAWGEPMAEAAARAIAEPPPLDLTLGNPDATEDWLAKLDGASLVTGHVRISRRPIADIPGFADGVIWVQDVSASLPARLLGAGEGRQALDLCAAPGGKTLQLAAQGWRVTAVDASKSRLARLSASLDRTGLAADIAVADIFDWQPEEPADAVLLDAPCTATGIFRRHPDVIHRISERHIAESAARQHTLIARAAQGVKPGGMLVYAVCSLEPEEGEAVAEAFLAGHPDFAIVPPSVPLPDGLAPTSEGYLRIVPGAIADPGGADGFFIAAFSRA